MVKESQTTGDSSGERKRFLFVDRWKQTIEKSIFLPVEESGQRGQIQRVYSFIFSPSGWELWQRRKELLIEGVKKALPKVEEPGIPVRAICVLKESDVPEEERKPQREDFYLIVVLELDDSDLEIARRMSRALQDWRDRELVRQDRELAKQLTIGWLRCE